MNVMQKQIVLYVQQCLSINFEELAYLKQNRSSLVKLSIMIMIMIMIIIINYNKFVHITSKTVYCHTGLKNWFGHLSWDKQIFSLLAYPALPPTVP